MSNPLRLILIDDNPDDCVLIIRELRKEFLALQVVQITESTRFTQTLEQGRFDLAITDYQLRWTDGLTVLRAIKSRYPDCPVIMFTGTGNEEIAVEAMKVGLDDYVIKSLKHFKRLPVAVQSVIERARERQEMNAERKRLEQAIRESEERLRSFMDSATDYFMLCDLELNIVEMNKAGLERFGLDRSVIGTNLVDFVPDLKETGRYDQYMEVIRTGEPFFAYDITTHPKFGDAHFEIKAFNAGKGLGIICIDITGRVKMEEALRTSEEQFRLLSEQSFLGIVIVQDGLIKYVNQAAADISNHSIEEMMNWHPEEFAKLIHPEDLPFAMEQLQKKQAGEPDVVLHYSYRVFTKTGELRWVEQYSKTIRYLGRPADFITLIDITERKQTEAARHDLERCRIEFISMTSHELRTPLTVIRGFVELLEQHYGEFTPERTDRCFEIVNRNIQRLERLITSVSTLGQIERGMLQLAPKILDFGKFLVDVMQPYLTLLEDQLELLNFHKLTSILMEIDPDKIIQVLDNLLENAIKHSPKDNRKIVVEIEVQSHAIIVEVSDNGAGIAPEDLDRIFEPFVAFTTEYSVGGTGIGLYLSRVLIEAHGGTLTAQSAGKGRGATFIIELPRNGGDQGRMRAD